MSFNILKHSRKVATTKSVDSRNIAKSVDSRNSKKSKMQYDFSK
jgi:hypothetical protein